jgi:hypothetical protein
VYTKEIGDGGGKWSRERSVFRGEDQDERIRLVAVY